MTWDENIEKYLVQLSIQAQSYAILHQKTSRFYNFCNLFLGVGAGLITTLTATLLSLPEYQEDKRQETERIVFASLLFLSSSFNFLQQFLSLETKRTENREYSKKYQIVYSQIKNELILPLEERKDAKQFLMEISEIINNYILTQPEINSFITMNFMKEVKSKKIFIPSNQYIEENAILPKKKKEYTLRRKLSIIKLMQQQKNFEEVVAENSSSENSSSENTPSEYLSLDEELSEIKIEPIKEV